MLADLIDLGRRPYREVWALQHALHDEVREGKRRDTWLLVEHDPVITLGRQAKRENIILAEHLLRERGIEVVAIERGGDVTYHGPGQLVVYPIRKLERFREIVPLVRSLESAVIATCATFGINAERWKEHAGVWVGRDQICAIGLAVQQMVSLHGIALNVTTALDYDTLITPCGLRDRGITSIAAQSSSSITLEAAKAALLLSLENTFEVQFRRRPTPVLPLSPLPAV